MGRDAPGGRAIAQVDEDQTRSRFAVALADGPPMRDVRLEVRCKMLRGKVDQACGLAFRARGEGDHYVVRANALEDNVRLYHVVKGKRTQIASWDGKVTAGAWHSLVVEARGDRIRVAWDGRGLIDAVDRTLDGPGRVGFWIKADSVTLFAGLAATPP